MARLPANASLSGLILATCLALACSGPATPSDAGPVELQRCPTSGLGGVTSARTCWVFSPSSAGASAAGQNASRANYALEPSGTPRRTLVVVLNGSGSMPGELTIDPNQNLFTAALESGNHVLAVAYRSDLSLIALCGSARPDCYGPSRQTLITGVFTPGSDSSLANIRADEGIIARIDQALRALVIVRPQAGWDAFINASASTASDRIAWQRIIVSGHSQGGGHAAYLAKLFPVSRVVQFASTCDAPGGIPAPWTDANSSWVTSPASSFYGLSAPTVFTNGTPTGGDLNCPYHLAVWQNLGMPLSQQDDNAATCAGIDPHAVPIFCSANTPRWVSLFR